MLFKLQFSSFIINCAVLNPPCIYVVQVSARDLDRIIQILRLLTLALSFLEFFLNFSISLVVVFFLTPPSSLQDLSFLTGSEPGPSAVKARSPNYWTTREFPVFFLNSVLYFLRQEDSGFPFGVSVFMCSANWRLNSGSDPEKCQFPFRIFPLLITLQRLQAVVSFLYFHRVYSCPVGIYSILPKADCWLSFKISFTLNKEIWDTFRHITPISDKNQSRHPL